MRLPSKTTTNIQRRKLLRQLLWSLCLVAPGSLLAANEGQDAKASSEAPKLTLPSFPAPVAAKTAATPASPESKPVTKPPTGLPTLPSVVAVPSEGASSQNATKLAPAKDAVIISMPNGSVVEGAEQQEKNALTTAPAVSGLESSGKVSVRFGDTASGEATRYNNRLTDKSPNLSATSPTPNPTSFRLSDKDTGAPGPIGAPQAATKPPIMLNMMVTPKAAPQEVVKTETANSGQKSAEIAQGAPVLLQATPIRTLPAVPNGLTSQPDESLVKNVAPIKIAPIKIAAPENATAQNAITENAITQLKVEPEKSSIKLSDSEQIEERVDIASAAANAPAKSVIIRPKPVILAHKPAAVVENKADIAQVPTPQDPAVPLVAATSPDEAGLVLPVMPVPPAVAAAPAKPSTTPQKIASTTESRAVAKMKEVDSKVSPLPPSQATEQVAVKAIDPVSPISEPSAKDVASSRSAEVTSTVAAPLVLPVMPQTVVSEPVLSELAPLALIPSVPVPPLLASTGRAVQGVSTNATGKPIAISNLAGEEAGLVVAAEENLSAVSVASSRSDAKAVGPKRYTKPADRMIQVGTVALTTMRVGENDVVKCEVDDTSICRAIVTADGSVAFLPGKVGVARATLWVKDPTGAAKVETADIQVGEILPVDQAESVEIGKLNESLQRLYPNTTLQVVASDRCIEIRGEADTEQQAREVLQLIRKLCLVPVKDKVVVR